MENLEKYFDNDSIDKLNQLKEKTEKVRRILKRNGLGNKKYIYLGNNDNFNPVLLLQIDRISDLTLYKTVREDVWTEGNDERFKFGDKVYKYWYHFNLTLTPSYSIEKQKCLGKGGSGIEQYPKLLSLSRFEEFEEDCDKYDFVRKFGVDIIAMKTLPTILSDDEAEKIEKQLLRELRSIGEIIRDIQIEYYKEYAFDFTVGDHIGERD